MLEKEKNWDIRNIHTIHSEIDSGNYNSRNCAYSEKDSSNIDYRVDCALAKRYGKRTVYSIIKKRLPVKEIIAIALALFVIIAAIPYVLPPLYGDFISDVTVSLDPDGVRVNAVLPGAVDTQMLRDGLSQGHLGSGSVEQRLEELGRRTVIGRVAEPAEIAQAILFLADSDRSSFMTGHGLIIDGGATARLSTE